jgi:transcriptional regulator with XRE-family HTH domain
MPKAKQHRESPTLAEILRDAAQQSGLSVYQIAKDAGVDQSTLNKFLNGDRDNLRLDVADRLFKFFGLRVAPDRPRARRSKSVSP